MSARDGWQRVNRERPCPICERPDWCLVSTDETAAICARTESAKRCGEAGWLHRLRDSPRQPVRRAVRRICLPLACPGTRFNELAGQFREAVDSCHLEQFADSLGLSVESLKALGIGWSWADQAWAFPMLSADGTVLGIRLRRETGKKFAVRGGKEGLFLPVGEAQGESGSVGSVRVGPRGCYSGDSTLLICEGPTDTAALLDMGFDNVVGRPSCTGGIKLLVELVRVQQPAEAVIVADTDEPGQRGASNLASVLVAYVPAVRVIQPPDGLKDARAWLQEGGTRQDVEKAIAAALVRRLTIR
jgi:5S rRNA maturation endonuclease (ribonuclease M5)